MFITYLFIFISLLKKIKIKSCTENKLLLFKKKNENNRNFIPTNIEGI